jgi:hypothetical protein
MKRKDSAGSDDTASMIIYIEEPNTCTDSNALQPFT